ncbi:hypothetical protein Dsin_023987 [Dipteronia sinensis]|uniref:Uncharacterized protein n=1 Tax=Dipteronia sinensis TaxID=43782 RepID=A0AAE0A595_9ROSI|nr:hypothetical protein Dsin_023987 [Dipteronia sinensis]
MPENDLHQVGRRRCSYGKIRLDLVKEEVVDGGDTSCRRRKEKKKRSRAAGNQPRPGLKVSGKWIEELRRNREDKKQIRN